MTTKIEFESANTFQKPPKSFELFSGRMVWDKQFEKVPCPCSGTQALYPAVLPSRSISHNILRFYHPMDTSQTSHLVQQSHSNFNVAIKRSACRGLVVGLTNTSCCGVRSAQPHRKCCEGWPLPLRQAKRRRRRSFLKREEVWRSSFSIWRGVLGNDIF